MHLNTNKYTLAQLGAKKLTAAISLQNEGNNPCKQPAWDAPARLHALSGWQCVQWEQWLCLPWAFVRLWISTWGGIQTHVPTALHVQLCLYPERQMDRARLSSEIPELWIFWHCCKWLKTKSLEREKTHPSDAKLDLWRGLNVADREFGWGLLQPLREIKTPKKCLFPNANLAENSKIPQFWVKQINYWLSIRKKKPSPEYLLSPEKCMPGKWCKVWPGKCWLPLSAWLQPWTLEQGWLPKEGFQERLQCLGQAAAVESLMLRGWPLRSPAPGVGWMDSHSFSSPFRYILSSWDLFCCNCLMWAYLSDSGQYWLPQYMTTRIYSL